MRVVWCVCCLGGLLSVWLVQECARVCESVWGGARDFLGGDFFEGFFPGSVSPCIPSNVSGL